MILLELSRNFRIGKNENGIYIERKYEIGTRNLHHWKELTNKEIIDLLEKGIENEQIDKREEEI